MKETFTDAFNVIERPTKIKLGMYTIPVIWDIDLPENDDEESLIGYWSDLHGEIHLCKTYYNKAQEVETFVHEMCHLIYWYAGCKKKDGEERIVTLMAPVWAELIARNPDVFAWVNKSLRDEQ